MIANLEKEELVCLVFSAEELSSELKWKHSREFEYKGEMYDIVHIQATEDGTVFHCWWDHEETALNQQLTALLVLAFNQDPLKKDQQNRLVFFLKHLYCSTENRSLELAWVGKEYEEKTPVQTLTPFLKVESPPPLV